MKVCSEDDCSSKIEARGLCSRHYQRAKAAGTLGAYARQRVPGQACKLDGCENSAKSRGYCARHYENFRRTGEPLSLHEQKAMNPKPKCAVDECDRDARSRGLCHRHYENQRIYGEAVPQHDLPIRERMERIGWVVTSRNCWEWSGKRNSHGYGIVNAVRQGRDGARAHRVMYELTFGELDPGVVVRHSCDNPPCVNPEHLRTGSQWSNMDDMAVRGRSGHLYENRGHVCKNGHDMTLPGAFTVHPNKRNGRTYRSCRQCARQRNREYRARQRAH